MAGETQTYTANFSANSRESISDVITNISPVDCVFTAAIGKGKAKAKLEAWIEDTLVAPSAVVAGIEGADLTPSALTYPAQVSNYTNYFSKAFKLADVMNYVDKVGRSDEIAFQKGKKLSELKTQIEYNWLNSASSSAGTATAARQAKGVKGFITTNADVSGWGATQASTQLLTETLFNSCMQAAWTVGGKPNLVLAPGSLKRQISEFTGNNRITVNADASEKKILSVVDFVETDFGTVKIVASRFIADDAANYKSIFFLETAMWEQLTLMPFRTEELAKNGPSTTIMIDYEGTLKCRSEKANARLKNIYAP